MNMKTKIAKSMADAAALNYDHNSAIFDFYAKAALEALKEPTEELIDCGQAALDCVPINRCVEQSQQVWQSMIQAALDGK